MGIVLLKSAKLKKIYSLIMTLVIAV